MELSIKSVAIGALIGSVVASLPITQRLMRRLFEVRNNSTKGSELGFVDPKLYQYVLDNSLREPSVLKELREETGALGRVSIMQISQEQGQFFNWLIKTMKAKKVIEVGVFTGYSSLCVATALNELHGKDPDCTIVACDISEKWTNVAKKYYKKLDLEHIIDLRIDPATKTLDSLIKNGEVGTYDFAFIDADKANYDSYYEAILNLLRPGGVIAVDNVLWHGKVIDESANDEDTLAIRKLNKKLLNDTRVDISLLPSTP